MKGHNRKLIETENFNSFIRCIDDIGIKLNNYIKSIGKTNPPE